MQLSEEQHKALEDVKQWFQHRRSQVYRLFGYAGTGKTTIARYFAEILGEPVQFAAYTGKAAQVLRNKGAPDACTIHSLIYQLRGEEEIDSKRGTGKDKALRFVLNRRSALAQASLLVIDECSMVDAQVGQDLLSFKVPILVLGDPGQLPPIGEGGFFTQQEPDFQLQEIFRQAADNPILALASAARLGKELPYADYGAAKVIPRSEVTPELVLEADQILVGTNRTRMRYNQRLRQLKGYEGQYPQSGDKLVCLRNDATKNLLNGSMWHVLSAGKETTHAYLPMLLTSEDSEMPTSLKVKVLKSYFDGNFSTASWSKQKAYDQFDYGYVLTVHKAQGSQWDNVVLFDESYAFAENGEKWLYTGITRAAKKLTIIR